MSRLDTYILRYGDFCANDNNTTDCFIPCAKAQGNNFTKPRYLTVCVAEI